MQSKNYTNPQDRGRFGFSMSGEYRAPYKSESIFVILLLSVAVGAGVALFFVLNNFAAKAKREEGDASTFVIIGGIIALILFVVILIVIFGVGIRSIKKGFLCKYTANDETFTTTIGGDLHVIQYKEVTNIHFQPRSSLGKIRGYDVTIKVKGRDEVYSVCSDGYLSPNSTPFFIIQERLDIIRRQHSPVQENTARGDNRAITRAEVDRAKTGSISAMDRMARLLGETSNMPELSASPSATERAVAEMEKMIGSHPSDEMQSIGAGASPSRSSGFYTDSTGRQQSMDSLQEQGSFYVQPSTGVLAALTVILMVLIGGAVYGLLYVFQRYNILGGILGDPIPLVAALAVQPFVFYFSVTRTHGQLYNYKADGRGFFVTVKGKGQDQILYKDVLSVDYKRTKLLWGNRGYKVDILTTYGVIHYDYIFPQFNQSIALKNLPFDVIKRNITKKDDTEQ